MHVTASKASLTTVLSVNHKGALQNWQAVEAAFTSEAGEDADAWLKGPLSFIPCFPCRMEPCGAVQQGAKVRVTTDKSWPKEPVGDVASVNSGIDLAQLGVTKFCRVLDFTKAVVQGDGLADRNTGSGDA